MVPEKIKTLQQRIAHAENRFRRLPESVSLLAVSKKCSAEQIIEAYQTGLRRFGESYLQEALLKMRQLEDYNIEWHFIGPIQSNKTSGIAQYFDWVHSIDRLKIAQRLNEQRPTDRGILNVCLQVNVSEEETKSGVLLKNLSTLVDAFAELPNLKLRGLMTIPARCTGFDEQCGPYHLLSDALHCLKKADYNLDTLSMGMSADLEAAICEGSTLVRVGSAIFGQRPINMS